MFQRILPIMFSVHYSITRADILPSPFILSSLLKTHQSIKRLKLEPLVTLTPVSTVQRASAILSCRPFFILIFIAMYKNEALCDLACNRRMKGHIDRDVPYHFSQGAEAFLYRQVPF